MGKNNAKMIDPNTLIQTGIDPKTGLPIRMSNENGCALTSEVRKNLRIKDEQTAIHRYTWYNLPKGLSGELIERVLYYRGQGTFFKLNDTFYFLPYALDGTIDVYGRFEGITPLPFNGTSGGDQKDKPWIQGLTFTPHYEIALPEDYLDKSIEELSDIIEKSCVLLHDYTPQISQTNIARQVLNDPILDLMSETIPLMRTALYNSTGVQGMRVNGEDEAINVRAANNAMKRAALNGDKAVPIVGNIDFQDLTSGSVTRAQEFMIALESLDNFRLSLYGIKNGGSFQKSSHMLQTEQDMAGGCTELINQDGLYNRQMAATIANTIWGTTMWVENNETLTAADIDGNGLLGTNTTNETGAKSNYPTPEGGTQDE